jgi:outer membrane biosynthesis protein TonB
MAAWTREISRYSRDLPRKSERELMRFFIMVSVAFHALGFLVNPMQWFRRAPLQVEEWAVDADLIPDLQVSAPAKSALPEAAVAPDAAIAKNLLPQLPLKVAVDQPTNAEGAERMDDPEAEQKPDTAATPSPPPTPARVALKSDPDEQNRIQMDDALKRLALEKLRQQAKEGPITTAEANEKLAKLKEEMADGKEVNTGIAGLTTGERNQCRSIIYQTIRRNYRLPDAYNLRAAELIAGIIITIGETGNIMRSEINKPSGDAVFDEAVMKAVTDSAPMPRGCLGEEFLINFSSRAA